jgi:hypothetical protein
MKKVLLIVILMTVVIGLSAQEKRTYYSSDTLNYQQLMEDYVSLNNQIMKFREYELRSFAFGMGASAVAIVGVALSTHNVKGSTLFWIASGAMGIASLVYGISGYTKLKRNQLEITPQGVIIKLTPQKSQRKTNK